MKWLLGLAAALLIVFGALHAFGLREDAAFLSGSAVSSVAGGIAYVVLYFAVVVVVPILVLAALFLAITRVVTEGPTRAAERSSAMHRRRRSRSTFPSRGRARRWR
jgi:hypothetical protein